jgi:hypothetical protein
LLIAITKDKKYTVVERASDFLAEIKKEQSFQRTGDVDDSQISKLGKQFGVDVVCICKITAVLGTNNIAARLVNVESATVIASFSKDNKLQDYNTLIATIDDISKNLLSDLVQRNKLVVGQTYQGEIPLNKIDEPIIANGMKIKSVNGYCYSEDEIRGLFTKSNNYNSLALFEKALSQENRGFTFIIVGLLAFNGIYFCLDGSDDYAKYGPFAIAGLTTTFIITGYVLKSKAKKNIKKAVLKYNTGKFTSQLYLGLTPRGVGLVYKF